MPNSDDLIYRYKGKTADAKFDKFGNALNIIHKIKNGEIRLADVNNDQENFRLALVKINKAPWNRSKEQQNDLYNIEML